MWEFVFLLFFEFVGSGIVIKFWWFVLDKFYEILNIFFFESIIFLFYLI